MARKEGLTDESTVTVRSMVVTSSREVIGVMEMTLSWEAIGAGVTMTARGVVKADTGARVKTELEQGVLRYGGGAPCILNRCNVNKNILKR